MNKFFLLFLLISMIFTIGVRAQVSTNNIVLNKMFVDIQVKEKNNYDKALKLAAQNGWIVRKTTASGKIIMLTGVDNFGNPKYLTTFNNTIAAATTKTNQLWPGGSSGLNLSGSSAAVKGKLAIWDGGHPLTTHVELAGRIFVKDSSVESDHATHTSGTLIASGVNPVAKGMAYGAQQLISYDFNNDQAEMSKEAPNLLLSNHSYGFTAGWFYDGTNYSWYGDTTISKSESYGFGYYDESAQVYDSIAYNAPYYLISMSAGNPRGETGPAVGASYLYNGSTTAKVRRTAAMANNPDYGSIAYTQNAKNILSVGAVSGIATGYNSPTDVVMSGFSAWGPTDDGRIKPDIVADGVNVTSSYGTSNSAYATEDGTSMSAPNATGSLYLLQEYYNKLHPLAFMRSATLRALAIHTTDEAGSFPGPDYKFGWGLLDVLKGANVITSSYKQKTDTIIESSLANGGTYTFSGIGSGNGVLTATVSWIDPPAIAFSTVTTVLNNTTSRLVNDLDMRITKGSTVYKPWILDPTNPANAATKGDNYLDNVEKITIDSIVPGQTYTITITHKGTLQRGNQAFSLLVSGIGGSTYCASSATSSAGTRIDSVAFGGIANKNTSGCTTYSDFTNLTGKIESSQTLPLTVKVNSCDASTASRVIKVYIDYNNNGSFTDPGELVATSSVITGSGGTFTTNITTPSGLSVGNLTLMRVVAEETSDTSVVKPCGTYLRGETQDYKILINAASNDLATSVVTVPLNSTCSDNSQLVQVIVQNKGTVNKSSVPLTAIIKNGNTTVATLTGIYPLLTAGKTATYTFQTPFASVAATTYTITAYVSATIDQNRSNDSITTTFTTAPKAASPTGSAEICDSIVFLRVTNVDSTAHYFWYDSQASTSALAVGTIANTSTITSNKTYYLGSGASGYAGLTSKNNFPTLGGYQTGGNYLSYTATVPVVLQSARLFTRRFGTVTIYAADFDSLGNGTILNVQTIDVYPTNPNYLTDAPTVNDAADTGAVFYFGFSLPSGSHSIYMLASDTLLFRNNNITGNPYPFSIPDLFTITGNSASTTYQNFYYYLYNMKITTTDCISDRIPIVANVPVTPVISQFGDSLVSSVSGTGYIWYIDSKTIVGANLKSYKPTQNGSYTVTVTDNFGCQKTSAAYTYPNSGIDAIQSLVYPNPTIGLFNVIFNISSSSTITIELISPAGQVCLTKTLTNFSGQYNGQFNVSNLANGIYTLKILRNDSVYMKRVVVIR
jgi:hypothetical protein